MTVFDVIFTVFNVFERNFDLLLCVFGGFWWFSQGFLKAFEYLWLFSLHAFFESIHVFDVILRIVDCFWWFIHVFLTIFNGFERFSLHLKVFYGVWGFLTYSQLFFIIFLRVFDQFSCFFILFLTIVGAFLTFCVVFSGIFGGFWLV